MKQMKFQFCQVELNHKRLDLFLHSLSFLFPHFSTSFLSEILSTKHFFFISGFSGIALVNGKEMSYSRSSHRRCSVRKGALRNTFFTEHLWATAHAIHQKLLVHSNQAW